MQAAADFPEPHGRLGTGQDRKPAQTRGREPFFLKPKHFLSHRPVPTPGPSVCPSPGLSLHPCSRAVCVSLSWTGPDSRFYSSPVSPSGGSPLSGRAPGTLGCEGLHTDWERLPFGSATPTGPPGSGREDQAMGGETESWGAFLANVREGWNLGKAASQKAEFPCLPVDGAVRKISAGVEGSTSSIPPDVSTAAVKPGHPYSSSSHSPPKTDTLSRHRRRDVDRVAGDVTGPPAATDTDLQTRLCGRPRKQRTEGCVLTPGAHGSSITLTSPLLGPLAL
ncbi:hypothetical protein E5288_WYG014917 [Bos mutus]|uniref:Uncharacterized protein n=1 Tax=Bos mutus TaxID=72004 RepID=A0A6B0S4N5_9CETA|nr:hypothetical protein [Bos mutus]